MHTRILRLLMCFIMLLGISCQKTEQYTYPDLSHAKIDSLRPFHPVQVIPQAPSRDKLEYIVDSSLSEMKRATISDLPSVYEYIRKLREYVDVVEILIERYKKESPQNYDGRAFIIGIIGELQRPDAFPFLHDVVWSSLPKPENSKCGLSAREQEEIVMVKAMQSITYLRSSEGFDETIKIILDHESNHVRISAIDAYMWNSGDTKEAALHLYELIPSDLDKFVERPRFSRNMDSKTFKIKVEMWLKKWGKTPGVR